MNILCLHRMGDPYRRREAVRALEYMVAEVRPDLNVIVHDSDVPLPGYMKDLDYDLIILGPTFLCNRYSPSKLASVISEFEFIKYSNACKVALPQDDYDCSQLLEDWLLDWDVSLVYTICPEHWPIIYPKISKKGNIRLGYTGYISQDWIDHWGSPKSNDLRQIDVSYRASKLPAYFGSHGQLKWKIAYRFLEAMHAVRDMRFDISVDPKDTISGKKWHDFLESSKFCLSTASGSSLHDPRGHIRSCVDRYVALNSSANFSEIESVCFGGEDRKLLFTMLSPRNLESALSETVQLATPGSYSGLMQPYEDFIPLEEDCSNIAEVLELMNDTSGVAKIKRQCKEKILSEPRLRCTNIVHEIIAFAENYLSGFRRGVVVDQGRTKSVFDRYKSEIKNIESSYWRRRRIAGTAHSVASKLGVRRIRDLILSNLD